MTDDLESLRNDVHLALIQAGVGDCFADLVVAIDVFVATAVLAALTEPPDVPF